MLSCQNDFPNMSLKRWGRSSSCTDAFSSTCSTAVYWHCFERFQAYLWTWKPLPEILSLETWYCDKHIFRIDISPEQKQIYSILQNSRGSLSLLAFFRLAGKVDDLYKAAAKLLEDDPLNLLDVLPLLLALLGLGEQALAGGLHHLLADEGERLPSAAGPCHNQRSRSSGQIEF